jgi:MoaA/NifB/PqqE/SkfB family radical SAM enzyme
MTTETKNPFFAVLNKKVVNIFKSALKNSLKHPKNVIFLKKTIRAQQTAAKKRNSFEEQGIHIPPFLIFSITHRCNLRCKGCYAHAFHDQNIQSEMKSEKFREVLTEARDLGISIVLLAGGEPLIRKDLLPIIKDFPEMIFPVFTNGTLLTDALISQLGKILNLIPVLSVEGHQIQTDTRRGVGVYSRLLLCMKKLKKKHIQFGTSITLTRNNFDLVTSDHFVKELMQIGCQLVFYIDYIPVEPNTEHLMLTPKQMEQVPKLTDVFRENFDAIFLAFPGDEQKMGGCLASGRGFLHISPSGAVEPCPFAPFSNVSLQDISLLEALQSPLFKTIRANHDKLIDTTSGCALWIHQDWLRSLISSYESP